MYKRSAGGWAKHWDFILIDLICLQMSFFIAYYIRFGRLIDYSRRNPYRTTSLVLMLLSIIVAIFFHSMHNVLSRPLWIEVKSTVIQSAMVFGGIALILFTAKDSDHVSRIVLYVTIGIYFFLALITRLIYKKILIAHKKITPKREMILVGDKTGIERAIAAFNAHPEEGINIKALVRVDKSECVADAHSDPGPIPDSTDATDIISGGDSINEVDISQAAEYICNEWIDEVYVACANPALTPVDVISQCREMAVTVHQQMFVNIDGTDKVWVEKIAKRPVLTTSINIPRPRQLIAKRCVDIVSGIALSILAAVTLIIFTPIIKILSPGPVLLKLTRVGQNGKRFQTYMIRTMYMDADERPASNRVIRGVGGFLRRWSLDRLPMGFNVLAGTMSLVGTRAPAISEWDEYEYHHRARLACKPGITGLYVVCGGGKELSFEEATRIDTEYITNWSFALDMSILLAPGMVRKQYTRRNDGGDAND